MTPEPARRTRTGGDRRRVPRHTLSAEAIVDAALRMLDDTDCEGISMRALAAELGVGTMTLYTYFRSKDELLQAARDQVLDSFHPPAVSGDWADRVRACCQALYRLLVERPAVLRVLAVKPDGDGDFADTATAALELVLSQLRAAGLGRQETARGYVVLLQYTFGSALRHVFAPARRAGETIPSRLQMLDPVAHPTIADLMPELVITHGGGEEQYLFGLDLILDGLRKAAAAEH
ncbi:TetR/AcrR family transcriptional regulator [Nocardia africana]|uniref:TetR/AcrR family transcriptional regulator n=1 Tax=Nocardia africana TaxID=134964 RepID=UPI001428B80D|nr:TetR/AcrR family transcriptional regulator C-terminal domain-containing protein [Nocardia africana]MCC3312148.1 TetR/AcrR family transcriptional regulator C-terminal domain-containing protein [Nocardia africana]